MPQPDDPIREEVERVVRAIATAPFVLPVATLRGVRRCVGRHVDDVRRRVAEPAAVVRSLFDLAGMRPPAESPPVATRVAPPDGATAPESPAGHGDDALPIEEYESLAASQVVARLPALTAEELGEVRRYEAANRNRRTVLGRIDQLLVPS